MKKLLFLSIAFLLFACSSKPESKVPEDITYSIVDEERNDALSKSNIRVRLNKKTTEDVLVEIAKEIKAEREGLRSLYIFYYPVDMPTTGIAWATSHYTPDLDVSILGSTEEEDEQSADTEAIPGEVLGKWRADASLMGAALIMYKDDSGKLFMQINFKSGNPMTEELKESEKGGQKRYDYDNTHGEYYILEKNGNLGMYDSDGKYDEAVIIE